MLKRKEYQNEQSATFIESKKTNKNEKTTEKKDAPVLKLIKKIWER